MKVRKLMFNTLQSILIKKEYSNIAINKAIQNGNLSDKDRRLYTQVVYGVLQNKLLLDFYTKEYLKGKVVKEWVRTLLAMSVYQMIFLDKIPMYAIINEAVEIAKEIDRGSSGMINAILRNFTVKEEPTDESILYSVDKWLYKQLKGQYPDDYIDILKSFNNIPKASARVNPLRSNVSKLLSDNIKKSTVTKTGVIFSEGNIANTYQYKKGFVTVQDEASQLVARMLNPKPIDKVLDVCAAPGGKTTHIAEIMKNRGEVIANDIHTHKLKLIEDNYERLGLTNITLANHDGTKLKKVYMRESFDKILLDAPCSGWGVITRKPELRYFQSEEKVEEITKLQIELLDSVAPLLSIDGILIYSTCTLNRGENEVQIKNFLERHKNYSLEKERFILPYENNTDGFYIAKLKKVSR